VGIAYTDEGDVLWRAWLYEVSWNCARSAIRVERKLAGGNWRAAEQVRGGQMWDDGLAFLSDNRPEDEDMTGEITWSAVQTAIDQLPDKYRPVILEQLAGILAYETAQRLGVTPQRVSQLRQEALALLRAALGAGAG
jgi:DNA-directed RNA polymerase specialized sigma24 family protein